MSALLIFYVSSHSPAPRQADRNHTTSSFTVQNIMYIAIPFEFNEQFNDLGPAIKSDFQFFPWGLYLFPLSIFTSRVPTATFPPISNAHTDVSTATANLIVPNHRRTTAIAILL